MYHEQIIIGLDIGTNTIKTIVGQKRKKEEKPLIIGLGIAESLGIRKGVVVDIEETVKAINLSVEKAEQSSGIPIERVYASIGGDHILSQISRGVVAVSRADREISQEDVSRAIEAAQTLSLSSNREIIHIIPINFSIDGQEQIKDPIGMIGVRLEVNALIIHGLVPFIKNISKCISEAGLEINDLVFSPLSASEAVLSFRQRELGVVVIDIGAGTTGISVFEEGNVIYCASIPMGANHITNDIAIGLRTSVNVAEKIKRDFGSAVSSKISKKENINFGKIEDFEKGAVSRRYLSEIVEARLSEIFSLVDGELKKINRSRLLPGGAVLTGGGAKSLIWRQILADILDSEIVTVNTTEGAAYGAALCALVGSGECNSLEEVCDQAVKVVQSTEPGEQTVAYNSIYSVYHELYPTLKNTFTRISTENISN